MSEIKLYEIPPSPNNMKARIALNYKSIPFERIPIDPQDRSQVVEISGQPLTPVMLHGETAIFDSSAILRYLEGNFRDTVRLFSTEVQEMAEIERWEKFARGHLVQPAGAVIGQYFAGTEERTAMEEASKQLNELTGRIEDRLGTSDWLVGDRMTAADVTAAPTVYYGMVPPADAEESPIKAFFARNLLLGEGRDRTRAWVERVMAYDR
jgi:glutathione S-transferase